MAKFIMLIGLPGCGKSTYARSLVKPDHFEDGCWVGGNIDGEPAVIVSSDDIREFLHFDPGTGSKETFALMSKLTRENLENGVSVVYDATNLVRKRRISILQEIYRYRPEVHAKLFTEPYEECLKRNKQRDPKWIVPEGAIFTMLKAFQVPMVQEGFATIEKIQTLAGEPIDVYLNRSRGFEQDNSHHALDLYHHQMKCYEYILNHVDRPEYDLTQAAKYHDIGKLLTKDFHNAKGEPSTEAHYYQHENVGAYLYLTADKGEIPLVDELYTAQLINWHMRSYQTLGVPKAIWEREFIGPKMYEALVLLHQADVSAH